MKQSKLYDILRKLDPTGPDGFEGLIAELLESLTGKRFFLAKQGYQFGSDMCTGEISSNIISVECKRYLKNTALNERELLGELEQAHLAHPDLDLWVLVASRNVTTQLQNPLSLSACKKGLEVFIIETMDSNPSSLATLCAAAPNVVTEFISKRQANFDKKEMQNILTAVSNLPDYPNRLKRLQENLSPAFIGYDNWRTAQNIWIKDQFGSETHSYAAFGQLINVADERAKFIKREEAYNKLDEWLATWSKRHDFLVMLGEEGDGKTWSVAGWLHRQLDSAIPFPGIIFVTSTRISSDNPIELIADFIIKRSGRKDMEFWTKRIENWLKRPPDIFPLIVLVIDGINERYNFEWRTLIERLQDSPWNEHIGVIITCRNSAWERQFSYLSYLKIQTCFLPPYNDKELEAALKIHNLKNSDINHSIYPLIRKPRYFDLAAKLKETISESGDITIERLIYEDWKDRYERKSHIKLSDKEFHSLLRDFAQKNLSEATSFSRRDVEDMLPENVKSDLEEFITGGIFVTDNTRMGKLKVEPRRLIQGFGLWLKEEVCDALKSNDSVYERIDSFLEPHRDMDVKVSICGSAVLYAVLDANFDDEARLALFRAWLNGRNINESDIENVISYFPSCPNTYMLLSEYVWSDAYENTMGQTLLMHGFLKWQENAKVRKVLADTFARWMGFVHMYGFPFQRGDEEKDQELKQLIEHRLGFPLNSDILSYAGYNFAIIQDDGLLLRLANVALAVISHSVHRLPYLKSIVIWALSRSIMGDPNEYDLVAWVLRTSREEIWDELKKLIDQLLIHDTLLAKQAAHRVLSCFGSIEAHQLKKTLPENLFPDSPMRKMYLRDPCIHFLWNREDYTKCLNREDILLHDVAEGLKEISLEPGLPVPDDLGERFKIFEKDILPDSIWKTEELTSEDFNLQKIETALTAFSPHVFANIVRGVFRDALNRNDIELRALARKIIPNLIVFQKQEHDAIEQVWRKLVTQTEDLNNAGESLFPAILYWLPAKEQLKAFLSRPKDACDSVKYGRFFKPLAPKYADEVLKNLANMSDEKEIIRTLWFLCSSADIISPSSVKYIMSFLKHKNTVIRSLILELIYKSDDNELLQSVANSDWSWNSENNYYRENGYGSLILSKFSESLTYQEIRSRIHPAYLGYGQRSGLKDS